MGETADRGRRRRLASALVPGLLAIVVAMGAGLRFHRLDAQSLWADELSSYEQSAHATLGEVIDRGVRPTPYPPAFQVLLYFVERHVGDSEVALRLPSAVAGVLAIAALFLLGRRLYGSREGLAAATLLAFSYSALYYSQEARAYACLLLFAILSMHGWFALQRALEAGERPAARVLAGYWAAASVAMYLHYFGLLLVALQLAGLTALYLARPRALAWIGATAFALLVLYLPWLPFFVEEFGSQPIYLREPGLHTLASHWRFLFYVPGDWLKWVAAALFAAALLRQGLAARGRAAAPADIRAWATSPTLLVLAWLVLPFLFAYVRSKMGPPILNDRNLIIGLPAAYLLAARAIVLLLARPVLQFAALGLYAAAMIQGIFVTGLYYDFPRKSQYREAAALVALEETKHPGSRIVAHAYTRGRFDYYLERTGATQRVGLLAGQADDVPRLRAYLEQERPRHLWLLDAQRRFEAAFLASLDPEYELVEHVRLFGASARLYRLRDGIASLPAEPSHGS